uniref:Uncharacterized protein n=1 Tax=Arundo donax TaxID=35708 RepID=A0A0A8ZK75_ARUDO
MMEIPSNKSTRRDGRLVYSLYSYCCHFLSSLLFTNDDYSSG